MKIKTKQKQQPPFFMAKDGVRKDKKHTLFFTTTSSGPTLQNLKPYASCGFFIPTMSVSFSQTPHPIPPCALG